MEENDNLNIINNDNNGKFKKILLMGKAGVGKTSIKSVIFQYQSPKDTLELATTNEIEVSHIKFMKNIHIKLLDCCSKEDYIKQYFDSKKNSIFSNVDILVFVAEAENNKHKVEHRSIDDIKYFEK